MGCFPCFGSAKKEQNNVNVVKEVEKQESFKEVSVAQSRNHVSRTSSGNNFYFGLFPLQFEENFTFWVFDP